MPVADAFWGDRYGVIEDPFGHRWSIATPQRKVLGKDLEEAAKAAMSNPEPAKVLKPALQRYPINKQRRK